MSFHENSSNGSHVYPHGQTDGRTYITKLTGGARNRKVVKSAWNPCSSAYHIKHKCILVQRL